MFSSRLQTGTLLTWIVVTLIVASHPAAAQSALPSGWTSGDVGNPVLAGSADSAGETITVRGAGAGTGDNSATDQFHFAYHAAAGDIDMIVRVSAFQSGNPAAKAGLMIRETLSERARNAYMVVTAGEGLSFEWRARTGRRTSTRTGEGAAAPTWLRLVREGNVFRGYSSPNGTEWTLVGTATINMASDVYVGLAVTSQDPAQIATAAFASSQFGTPAPSLPSPWQAQDVGSPGLAGGATASEGFTVRGAGADIWGTSDQFHFMYQPVTGDWEIAARVASLETVDPWTKAGVMIRAALDGPAAHASMFATGSSGWAFQRRLSSGGPSYHTAGSSGAAPGWVRLAREGNLFSAYQSQDGTEWVLVGTDTIAMPATVYVGLAVTSHNAAALATGTFTNVSVTTPTDSNNPPTISIISPLAGAIYTAPATITISAAAGDVDGVVTRVDFYDGGQLLGSTTASPFSLAWSDVPAGAHSLTAVATDNGGDTATSLPINLTVSMAVPPPTNVVFVPSVDYATNVTSWTVELRRSADPVSATPAASRNLGKPAVDGGEITVDISTLVNPLPAGSYYALIVSTGPGGSTPSSPSATFVK